MTTHTFTPDQSPGVGAVRVTRPYRAVFLDWITTTDHKKIGTMYAIAASVFFLIGGILAGIMRIQLALPENDFVTRDVFNQSFTMHGTIMVFLFLMPMLAALGNWMVPLQVGAADMAYPKVNALAFWMVPLGGTVLLLSYLMPNGPHAGSWVSYPPLADVSESGTAFLPGHGVDLWIGAIAILGISSTLGSINFIVTVYKMRAPGMTMLRVPIFTWTVIVQSFLAIFSLPVVTAGLAMLWISRNLGGRFFDPSAGGDPILYQHIFWYFGHPEVYILVLPVMGVVSEIIPVFSRKPLFGYKAFIFATLSIAALGTMVWAHHMFTTGAIQVHFFAFTSFLISVPTGVKMFNWTATMYKGKIEFTSAMLFALGFLMMFLIGGITGVFNATGGLDFSLHDTYFVVSHFHYVLVSAALFGLFAGFYYWFPKMSGRMLNETVGKVQFVLLFLGVNFTFLPQMLIGLDGMPRRIPTYTEEEGWGLGNLISSYGYILIALAAILFLLNVLLSMRRGKISGDNPWDAYALEWATSSPPPYYNFDRLPLIRSERPVFDENHPEAVATGDH